VSQYESEKVRLLERNVTFMHQFPSHLTKFKTGSNLKVQVGDSTDADRVSVLVGQETVLIVRNAGLGFWWFQGVVEVSKSPKSRKQHPENFPNL